MEEKNVYTQYKKALAEENEAQMTVIKTGFYDLDSNLGYGGLERITLLIGDSGVGKTYFMSNLLNYHVDREDGKALIISQETGYWKMLYRILQIPFQTHFSALYKMKSLDESKFRAMVWDNKIFKNTVIETGRQTVKSIRELIIENKPTVVYVDHLHIIEVPVKGRSETEDLKIVCAELMDLYDEMQIPLVLLCQLNKGHAENTGNEGGFKPSMNAVFGASAVKQLADYAIGIWRPELHNECNDLDKGKVFAQMIKIREASMYAKDIPAKLEYSKETSILKEV